MFARRQALMGAAAAAILAAMPPMAAFASEAEIAALPRKQVTLVAPPFVHAHEQVAKDGPKVVEFAMTMEEKPVVIDDEGTMLQGMTFNGSIPAPMMVVHEGDYVELTLVNPGSNSMPHNIDFHAATGALGGGALTLINPGEQVHTVSRLLCAWEDDGIVRSSRQKVTVIDPHALMLVAENRRKGSAS